MTFAILYYLTTTDEAPDDEYPEPEYLEPTEAELSDQSYYDALGRYAAARELAGRGKM